VILLDGTLEQNVPQIMRNIATLGFRVGDVKLLLNSHAHFDHAAGLSRLKRETGARMLASAADRGALEAGRPTAETNYGVITFPAVRVDGVLTDGVPVRLGDVALTPLLTPGHTPGCTSWSLRVKEAGRPLRVLFPCSLTVAGNRLIDNPGYPAIVADFRAHLPAHGDHAGRRGVARPSRADRRPRPPPPPGRRGPHRLPDAGPAAQAGGAGRGGVREGPCHRSPRRASGRALRLAHSNST
jgi:hypothetical protein